MTRSKIITRNVWILSIVSLFTDVASEMLYPIMPVYLKTIGFSIMLIGILESLAEATAGFSKGYFGGLSDARGKRLPFVQLGYGLSAISKPLMAIFIYPVWIFFARTLDRLGKGIRTGARDALLSDEATPQTKGRVFGFHRAMDTLGAVTGPALALLYLYYYPGDYKFLFFVAFLPGILAIACTFFIKEKSRPDSTNKPKPRLLDFIRYFKTSTITYKKLVVGLVVFALFNSSDIFLLLKIKEAGYSDVTVIGVYIFYNLVYAAFAFPLGALADKMGMKKVLVAGLFIFALVYGGMAFAKNEMLFFALFFMYGIYAAATEGVAKAWITNLAGKDKTATAVGTYTAFQSMAALIASSAAGVVWYMFGAPAAFLLSAGIAVAVSWFIAGIKTK